jgi:hypothetical protein
LLDVEKTQLCFIDELNVSVGALLLSCVQELRVFLVGWVCQVRPEQSKVLLFSCSILYFQLVEFRVLGIDLCLDLGSVSDP